MVTISFFLKNPKANKSPIYISVHVNGKRLTPISIGESVNCDTVVNGKLVTGQWDKDKQRVRKSHDFAPEINNKIENIYLNVGRTFRQMLNDGNIPTSDDLQNTVKPGKNRAKKQGNLIAEVYTAWSEWYRLKENRGITDWQKLPAAKQKGHNYIRSYKAACEKYSEFAPNATLQDFLPKSGGVKTSPLYEKFLEWVHEKYPEMQDSSRERFPVFLRTLLRFSGLPYDWLESSTRATSSKYSLRWEELMQLNDKSDYSTPEIRAAAEAIIIVSQLALRWSDIETLKPQHYIQITTNKHGKVYCIDKSQEKTGNPVLVPIPPLAESLLKKHNFQIPLPRTNKGTAFRQSFSEVIKDAAEEAKLTREVKLTTMHNGRVTESWKQLHEVLSPHDLRHTGATLLRIATKNNELSALLLGHSNKNVTAGYVHVEPELIADDILDAWEYFTK